MAGKGEDGPIPDLMKGLLKMLSSAGKEGLLSKLFEGGKNGGGFQAQTLLPLVGPLCEQFLSPGSKK